MCVCVGICIQISVLHALDSVYFNHTLCIPTKTVQNPLINPSPLCHSGDVEILRPHFLRLVAQYYPEVTHLERLREISDLSSPAQW